MKKILFTAMCASAALLTLATACQKENIESAPNETNIIPATCVIESNDTKAYFGEKEIVDGKIVSIPTLWNNTEYFRGIIRNKTAEETFTHITNLPRMTGTSTDNKILSLDYNASGANYDNESVQFAVATPSGYMAKGEDGPGWTQNNNVMTWAYAFDVPAEQKPTINGPSTNTAKYNANVKAIALVGVSKVFSSQPSDLKFTFKHVFSYINLKLQGLNLVEGEQIEEVSITSNKQLAGTVRYNCATGNSSSDFTHSTKCEYYTINAKVSDSGINPEDGYLMSVCPSKTIVHEEMSVKITTNLGHVFEKEFQPNFKFEAGKVKSFTVNINTSLKI